MVKPEDCVLFNYSFSNFSNKEVGFKPAVDLSPFLGNFKFKGHTTITKRQTSRSVRVSFKNVPLNVPDQELLNIIECYGEATDAMVSYHPSTNPKARGIVNANTRHIEMILSEKKMPNFFWLEGPLPGDSSSRVTATYPGQTPQCYNCLRIGNLCPAEGKGKLCVELKTQRLRMDLYVNSLKLRDNYSTLKYQYESTSPLPGSQVRGVVRREQEVNMGGEEEEEEEEKDMMITSLKNKLKGAEERGQEQERELEQVRLEQEDRCRKMEQDLEKMNREMIRKEQEQERELEQVRLELEGKCQKMEHDLDSMSQEMIRKEQEVARQEQENSNQENLFREEQKSELLKVESKLSEMLTTSESTEEITTSLADLCYLPDFHLQVGSSEITVPEGFLESTESLIDDTNRERFLMIRKDVLKKIVVRKKFAAEIGLVRERSIVFRATDRSKRKSEAEHKEGSSTARSRLEASSFTPPPPSPPPPREETSTPPLHAQLPPRRPTTPHPKVRDQEQVTGMPGDHTTML